MWFLRVVFFGDNTLMKNQNGFGLLGLLITVSIIFLLILGGFSLSRGREKNRIEQGRESVDQAQDAADEQREYNQNLQDTMQNLDPPRVDYGSARDKANSLR